MNESLPVLIRRAAALQKQGRASVACLVVRSRGSTPQTPGALMLVDDTAGTYGTIGGGCVEAEVRRRAFDMLARSASGVLRFKLDHDYGWDDGLICGGTIDVAVGPWPEPGELERVAAAVLDNRPTSLRLVVSDSPGEEKGAGGDGADQRPDASRVCFVLRLAPRERLLIAGAGHVGQALARLALRLDFEVSLYDDRPDLLERFAPPDAARIAGPIEENLRAARVDGRTYAVVVTRGHRHDQEALHAVVNRGARYVGMIGSRRKVRLITDGLRDAGVPEEALRSVHAPIGLDIGGITVEEIAISIAAQLVQVRRAEKTASVEGPMPVVAGAVRHEEFGA